MLVAQDTCFMKMVALLTVSNPQFQMRVVNWQFSENSAALRPAERSDLPSVHR